jgi:hypothetical protein
LGALRRAPRRGSRAHPGKPRGPVYAARGTHASAGAHNDQPAAVIAWIIDATGIAPAVNQFEIHPYFNNDGPREACERHGIAIEAHSPLRHNGEPLKDETIQQIAGEHEKSVAQVILRWHMQNGIIAIPKSAKREGRVGPTPTPTRASDRQSETGSLQTGRVM